LIPGRSIFFILIYYFLKLILGEINKMQLIYDMKANKIFMKTEISNQEAKKFPQLFEEFKHEQKFRSRQIMIRNIWSKAKCYSFEKDNTNSKFNLTTRGHTPDFVVTPVSRASFIIDIKSDEKTYNKSITYHKCGKCDEDHPNKPKIDYESSLEIFKDLLADQYGYQSKKKGFGKRAKVYYQPVGGKLHFWITKTKS
jgi:hypothetical protein